MNLKRIVREVIIEAIESYGGFDYDIDWYDYHHSQADGTATIKKNNKVLAHASITNFKNKIYIKNIEANIEGFGYGKMLMRHLAKEFGYENLERSSLTPAGVKMRKTLDNEYGFNYEKYKETQSKHLDPSIINQIKNPVVREFLRDMITIGYEKTWQKWLKYPKFKPLWDQFDFNDISEISTWIKTSVTNNHDIEEEPDFYVLDDLKKLM